jgi:hypothetical protein
MPGQMSKLQELGEARLNGGVANPAGTDWQSLPAGREPCATLGF